MDKRPMSLAKSSYHRSRRQYCDPTIIATCNGGSVALGTPDKQVSTRYEERVASVSDEGPIGERSQLRLERDLLASPGDPLAMDLVIDAGRRISATD